MSVVQRQVVVLDTNVLLPQVLRDLLLRCAAAGLYRAHWSVTTIEELLRNLGPVAGVTPSNAERLVRLMRQHFEDAEVTSWPATRLTVLPVPPDDRHVLAAAIQVRANAIVTENTRHFPNTALKPYSVTAVNVDSFLMGLLDSHEADVLAVIRSMSTRLTRPSMSSSQIAQSLHYIAPGFADKAAALLSAR